MKAFKALSIRCDGKGTLEVMDQRKLPDAEVWLPIRQPGDMVAAIKQLSVRGAPLIGIAAAMSLAQYADQGASEDELKVAAEELRQSRPTAVNLANCLDHILSGDLTVERIDAIAAELQQNDIDMCNNMAKYGAELVQPGETILTHCNTGGLATVGCGTAIGVIGEAHKSGKGIKVIVDETRPLLQGGRLTTWELTQLGVPYRLITDSMAGHLMSKGLVQRVFVGADRIALNGDFANKIGTYTVAVLCKEHNIPFHVVAPASTIDFHCPSGKDIPIEERNAAEVRGVSGSFGSVRWAVDGCDVYNPAFDVTPARLVTSWVTDKGVLTPEDIANHGIDKQAGGIWH